MTFPDMTKQEYLNKYLSFRSNITFLHDQNKIEIPTMYKQFALPHANMEFKWRKVFFGFDLSKA